MTASGTAAHAHIQPNGRHLTHSDAPPKETCNRHERTKSVAGETAGRIRSIEEAESYAKTDGKKSVGEGEGEGALPEVLWRRQKKEQNKS